MSQSFPPTETQPSKLEQAKERLQDLFVVADELRHQAHEASLALDSGDWDMVKLHLTAAEKTAGIMPARHKWAELAVAGAAAEVVGG